MLEAAELGFLSADEPAAFELVRGSAPIIFICDHASNRVPAVLGDMGLAPSHLIDHIAWDIGAAGVARRLRERFDATMVLAGYSRLAVDMNRGLRDASAFPAISDGVLIPANVGLTEAEREERAEALFFPYHGAIDTEIERLTEGERTPAFIGVHSFTPRVHSFARTWQLGILWDKDPRIPVPLLAALRADADAVVGDNEPYSGRHPADYSMDHHAEPFGLAHASIEIRQDLIGDARGQALWAERLGDALAPILADTSIYRRLGA